jgi:hypothetical protein
MKRSIKIIFILFIGLSYKASYCQDTATSTFKIGKEYVSLCGKTNDTISWEELINSDTIELHGYQGCIITEYHLSIRPDKIDRKKFMIVGDAGAVEDDSRFYVWANTKYFESKSAKITHKMRSYFNRHRKENNLKIEVYAIKIINEKKEEVYANSFTLHIK